jgi:hypothetical protein
MKKGLKIGLWALGGVALIGGSLFAYKKLSKKTYRFDWVGRQLASDGKTTVAGLHITGIGGDASTVFEKGEKIKIIPDDPFSNPEFSGEFTVDALYSDENPPGEKSMIRVFIPMENGKPVSGKVIK